MSRNRLSYEEFAQLVMEVLKESGRLKYESERFAVVELNEIGEPVQRILLGGFYGEYAGLEPSERPQLIARIESLFLQKAFPATYETAAPMLLPHIVDRWSVFRSNMHLALGAVGGVQAPALAESANAPDFAPFSVIAEAFALVLAIDLPETRVIVTDHQLSSWQVSFEAAVDQAYDNLVKRSGGSFEILADQQTGQSNLYSSTWHDGYDASRLLIDALLEQFKVHGDCVIAVPTSNQLLVTGSQDGQGLLALHSYLVESFGRPGSLPPVLIHKDKSGWHRFIPEGSDQFGELLNDMYSAYLSDAYAGQKALLKASMDVEGLPIIDYERRPADGKVRSWAVVPPVPHALVPETDFVKLVKDSDGQAEVLASASFEQFKAVLGDSLVDVEQYPVRYLLRSYPSAEQISRLGLL